jgi:alkaline phosphatase D
MKKEKLLMLAMVLVIGMPKTCTADIVAYWNFDEGFGATIGGPQFDLSPVNGPTAGIAEGRFGNAASFVRANSQFAFVGNPVITPNSSFSYSAWFNFPGTINGAERHFVLETTSGPEPSDNAWTASLGLRQNATLGQYAEFFTHPSLSFGSVPFQAGWNNAIVTYDANGGSEPGTGLMRSFFNGVLIGTADNRTITNTGGLVIGGHRMGTGRNFNGFIDDVAFFDHVLTPEQIGRLQSMPADMAMIPEPGSAAILMTFAGVALLRRKR